MTCGSIVSQHWWSNCIINGNRVVTFVIFVVEQVHCIRFAFIRYFLYEVIRCPRFISVAPAHVL